MTPRRTTIALSLTLLALAGCETAQPPAPPNTLVALKVSAAPNMAALAADPAWAKAQPLSFRIGDGVNFAGGKGETNVTLKAAYTADMLYMLVQYADPTNSVRRSPYQKQPDGSWKQLKDPQNKGGDDNVYYEDKWAFLWEAKCYVLGDGFEPVFDFPPERVLAWLTQGFGDGEPSALKCAVVSEIPSRLTHPDLDVLASVTRAIHLCRPLRIEYHSISSGRTAREIAPFALIDTGLRWHVRAFDRKTREFRDFVITRIKKPVVLMGQSIAEHEGADQDIQWTRIVEVEICPHPDQPRPEVTEMDYGMSGGALRLKLRAATAGYVLRKWSVDCSPDHCLRGHEYRLWLRDSLSLYGVRNAVIAPGYRMPSRATMVEAVTKA